MPHNLPYLWNLRQTDRHSLGCREQNGCFQRLRSAHRAVLAKGMFLLEETLRVSKVIILLASLLQSLPCTHILAVPFEPHDQGRPGEQDPTLGGPCTWCNALRPPPRNSVPNFNKRFHVFILCEVAHIVCPIGVKLWAMPQSS